MTLIDVHWLVGDFTVGLSTMAAEFDFLTLGADAEMKTT